MESKCETRTRKRSAKVETADAGALLAERMMDFYLPDHKDAEIISRMLTMAYHQGSKDALKDALEEMRGELPNIVANALARAKKPPQTEHGDRNGK